MNILVVDDEPFMRDAYLNLIDWVGNGLNLVGIAYDAFKALDIMHTTHIDVVITDIRMPKMSGIELIRQAKKEFPHIDFIVMSGYGDYSLVREAFVLGIKDYFLKDEIEPDHILEKLLELKKDITDKKVSAEENSSNQYLLQDNDYKFYNCEGLLKKLIWDGSKLEETERLFPRAS